MTLGRIHVGLTVAVTVLVLVLVLTILVSPLVHLTGPAGAAEPTSRRAPGPSTSSLGVRPAVAVRGERVTVSGRVPGHRGRVRLERSTPSGWAVLATRRAGARGAYAIEVRALWPDRTTLRVVPVGAASGATPTRTVRVVGQSVRIGVPATAYAWEDVRVSAVSAPARPGRPALLQQRVAGMWRTVASSRQDARGRTTFAASSPRAGVLGYRVVVPPARGAAQVVSRTEQLRYAEGRVVVSDDVRVLSAQEARAVSVDNLTGDLLVDRLAGPTLAAVRPGDVLVIPPRPVFASGALRRVTARTDRVDAIVLETREVDLPDVVREVPDDQTGFATPVVSQNVRPAPGVTVVPRTSADPVGEIHLAVNIDVPRTMGPDSAVTVSGDLRLLPRASLSYDVDGGVVDRYAVASGVEVDDALTVVSNWSTRFSSLELGELTVVHAARIGRLPVWIATTVSLVLLPGHGIRATVDLRHRGLLAAGVAGRGPIVAPRLALNEPQPETDIVEVRSSGLIGGSLDLVSGFSMLSRPGATISSDQQSLTSFTNPYPAEFTCRTTLSTYMRGGADGRASSALALLTGRTTTALDQEQEGPTRTSDRCPPPTAPQVVTTEVPELVIDEPYRYRVETADGRRGRWSVVDGVLPPGIALSDDGYLQGTTHEAPSASTITVRLVDFAGAVREVPLTIATVAERSGARWRSFGASDDTTCGVHEDGTGWCWGDNEHGQVGDGTTTDRSTPVQVAGEWTSIQAGDTTCGIRTDNSLWCWGDNRRGRTGVGGFEPVLSPAQVTGSWRAVDVGLGACAIRTDDTLWCWGYRLLGHDDDPETDDHDRPAQVGGSWSSVDVGSSICGVQTDRSGWCLRGDVEDGLVAVRRDHLWQTLTAQGCGIRLDGTGWCHNDDDNGPVPVGGVLRQLDGGLVSGCAVQVDGAGWCWGYNDEGQVGDGTQGESLDPVPPRRLPGTWRAVHYDRASCGVRTDDTLWCWGQNYVGDLGDGQVVRSTVPTQVAGRWDADSLQVGACAQRTDSTAWCWGRLARGRFDELRDAPLRQPTQAR